MTTHWLETNQLPRLGQINYINSLPISLPLSKGIVCVEADIAWGTPQELNHRYAANSLELGAMSAFFFLQRQDFLLLPEFSISSNGAVGSVIFFSKSMPERGRPVRVLASSASATSVNLLSVLLQEEFKVRPVFSYDPTPDLNDEHVDAALVIGDYALNVDLDWSRFSHRFDLGEWWLSRYGLPMVFGVWAARTDWQSQHSGQCDRIVEKLKASLSIGLSTAFNEVVEEAVKRSGLPQDRLQRYFRRELDLTFSSEHQKGLNRYKSLCEKYGLLGPLLPERRPHQMPVG